MIYPDKTFIDPICTFIFSVIVLFTTINVTKRCLTILMEASPLDIEIEDIEKDLQNQVKSSF